VDINKQTVFPVDCLPPQFPVLPYYNKIPSLLFQWNSQMTFLSRELTLWQLLDNTDIAVTNLLCLSKPLKVCLFVYLT